MANHNPHGHVRVEERAGARRVWVAEYQSFDGRTRKTLGPAWVRQSGKTTARGAVIWRAAHGSKPDDTYLTPADAQARLQALLDEERRRPARRTPAARGKTFGDAIAAYLHRVEFVAGVEETTLRNYRIAAGQLQKEFPADMPLRKFTAERIDAYQTKLLTTPVVWGKRDPKPLSRKTVRNRMLVLGGILQRARALEWIAANPAIEVMIVPDPGASPDFNVLNPRQVEQVAAAMALVADDELPLMRNGEVDEHCLSIMREARTMCAEAVRLAAYSGLRFGELRDLRWRDIDRTGRNLHVRRNHPDFGTEGRQVQAPEGPPRPRGPADRPGTRRRRPHPGRRLPHRPRRPRPAEHRRRHARRRQGPHRLLPRPPAADLGYLRTKNNPMTVHDLRHTFGTLGIRKAPVTDMQQYLGHAQIQTTMRYVHFQPRNEAARELSEAFAVAS